MFNKCAGEGKVTQGIPYRCPCGIAMFSCDVILTHACVGFA